MFSLYFGLVDSLSESFQENPYRFIRGAAVVLFGGSLLVMWLWEKLSLGENSSEDLEVDDPDSYGTRGISHTPAAAFCSSCGAPSSGFRFCGKCGTQLGR
jgi:hypothetical protein